MHAQMYRQKASSFRGVYRCGKKWKSQIQIDGVQYYLGVFPTEDRAAEEYRIAARRLGKAEDVEYVQMYKEYAQSESETGNMKSSSIKQPVENNCFIPTNYAPALSSSSSCSDSSSSSSSGSNSSSSDCNPLPNLYIPTGPHGNLTVPSMHRSVAEDKVVDDLRSTSFYLIPTNELSLISSKVKLGKLGEEISDLSRICEEASLVATDTSTTLNNQKLIALRSAMFHSIQLIRNTSSSAQLQTKGSRHLDITDDGTMYEV